MCDLIVVTVSDSIFVTSIVLNQYDIRIEKKESVSLAADVFPGNATNRQIEWTSADHGIATVINGVVTGVNEGNTRIYATAKDGNGAYTSCIVRVTGDSLVRSIDVIPESKIMMVGDVTFLGVTVLPTDAEGISVLWESSNPDVAVVNKLTGFVMAQHAGEATISATSCDGSNVVGYCSISVDTPIAVKGIEVYPKTIAMNVGEKANLSVEVFPTNAANKTIAWRSDNSSVALVTAYGMIIAITPGKTRIIAASMDDNPVITAICETEVKKI